jgi:hypothetical protein
VPTKFRTHSNEDIGRAENLLARSHVMEDAGEPGQLYKDVRLSSVALAVGALDAYLSDAYVDCLTAVLRAYTLEREYATSGFSLKTSTTIWIRTGLYEEAARFPGLR